VVECVDAHGPGVRRGTDRWAPPAAHCEHDTDALRGTTKEPTMQFRITDTHVELVEDEVTAHMPIRIRPAAEDATAEAEGHMPLRRSGPSTDGAEGHMPGIKTSEPAYLVTEDAEGHVIRRRLERDAGTADVEGHMPRIRWAIVDGAGDVAEAAGPSWRRRGGAPSEVWLEDVEGNRFRGGSPVTTTEDVEGNRLKRG
jgi:hypothetical protein